MNENVINAVVRDDFPVAPIALTTDDIIRMFCDGIEEGKSVRGTVTYATYELFKVRGGTIIRKDLGLDRYGFPTIILFFSHLAKNPHRSIGNKILAKLGIPLSVTVVEETPATVSDPDSGGVCIGHTVRKIIIHNTATGLDYKPPYGMVEYGLSSSILAATNQAGLVESKAQFKQLEAKLGIVHEAETPSPKKPRKSK